MTRPWEADPQATFSRRLGKTALELDKSAGRPSCPDIWELSNGDVAVIGRDLTPNYLDQLPNDVSIGDDERLVVIPGIMLRSAKEDIPDE
ncbi:MAG TPA: hypothetical protein VJ914_20325 [Pseudonocardiaceae bacterium]|nr:hypothetical protein [Pseudonocardiaceae bacterium]